MQSGKCQPRYHRLYSPQELDLLDYNSLVEGNQFQYVYKPNDDTFLMLSTLRQEISSFEQDMFICQVGSGSGILSANLNHWLTRESKAPLMHISIDVNMDASLLSQKYYSKYNLNISQINASLFNNFSFTKAWGKSKPDVIMFNPPYVPVDQEQLDTQKQYLKKKLEFVKEHRQSRREKEQNMIAYSYMGGLDGLAVTRKFLKQISWKCTVYFIVMGEEGMNQILKEIKEGFACNCNGEQNLEREAQIMQNAQFYNEDLFVVRLTLKRK